MRLYTCAIIFFVSIGCSGDVNSVVVNEPDDASIINSFLDARLDPQKGRLSRTIKGKRANSEIFDSLIGDKISDYPQLFTGQASQKGRSMLEDDSLLLPGQRDWITGRHEDADCYWFVTDMWEIENVDQDTDLLVFASVDGVIVDWKTFPFFPY